MNNRGRRRRVTSAHLDFDPDLIKRLVPGATDLPSDQPEKRMMIHALRRAWNTVLTPIQREYMVEYYINMRTMQRIAVNHGVTKGTVSRTLRRGRKRLCDAIQYCQCL